MGTLVRLAVLLVALLAFRAHANDFPPELTRYELKRATVVVDAVGRLYNGETDRNIASGALISRYGHVLTVLHVIGDLDQYRDVRLNVYFTNFAEDHWSASFSPPFSATVVAVNDAYDLAIIKLDNPTIARALPIVPIAFATGLPADRQLVGYSYPAIDLAQPSQEPASTDARVSRPARRRPFWEISGAANPGDSGGPLLDLQTGKAVAVTHGRVAEFRNIEGSIEQLQSLSWAIPMDGEVRKWLRQYLVPASESEPYATSPEPQTEQITYAELLRSGGVGDWSDDLFVAAPYGRQIAYARIVGIGDGVACPPLDGSITAPVVCSPSDTAGAPSSPHIVLNGAMVVVDPRDLPETGADLELVTVPRQPLMLGDLRIESIAFSQSYRFSRQPTVSRLRALQGNSIQAAMFVPDSVEGIELAPIAISAGGTGVALGGRITASATPAKNVSVTGTVVTYELPINVPAGAPIDGRTVPSDLSKVIWATTLDPPATDADAPGCRGERDCPT